jgi:hypothetical protein
MFEALEKIAHPDIVVASDVFSHHFFDGWREHPRIEKPEVYFTHFIKQISVIFDSGFEVVEEVGLRSGGRPLLLSKMVYDRSPKMEVVNVVEAVNAVIRQSWSEMRSERKAIAARLAFIIAVGFDRGIPEAGGALHKRSNRRLVFCIAILSSL